MNRFVCAIAFVVVLLSSASALCAQDSPAPAATTPPAAKVTSKTLFQYYMAGGVLMHPMSLGLFGVVWLVLYHMMALRRTTLTPAADIEPLNMLMYQRDVLATHAYCEQHRSFLTAALAAGVLRLNPDAADHGKAAAEAAIGASIDEQETCMSFWLNLLSVIAAISPMLGLLGTVQGMIGAFDKIGAGGMGKPELLAADIGIALITTFYGLIIGIPAMLAFFVFRGILNARLGAIAATLTTFLDLFTGEGAARRVFEQRMVARQAPPFPYPQPAAQPQPFPAYQPPMPPQ